MTPFLRRRWAAPEYVILAKGRLWLADASFRDNFKFCFGEMLKSYHSKPLPWDALAVAPDQGGVEVRSPDSNPLVQ